MSSVPFSKRVSHKNWRCDYLMFGCLGLRSNFVCALGSQTATDVTSEKM